MHNPDDIGEAIESLTMILALAAITPESEKVVLTQEIYGFRKHQLQRLRAAFPHWTITYLQKRSGDALKLKYKSE